MVAVAERDRVGAQTNFVAPSTVTEDMLRDGSVVLVQYDMSYNASTVQDPRWGASFKKMGLAQSRFLC